LKVRVSAVSYLNTLPFLYGINHSSVKNEMELSLDIPSDCAKKLLNDEVDLGLVPVAIIPQLKEYHIISDYCIGANGEVNTVALYSDVPLNQIETIYLDFHSKTSINLVQVLAKKYWKISPKFVNAQVGFEQQIKGNCAGVIIGDRTFNLHKTFKYKFDLANEWKKMTGLPFVFACWVANKNLPTSFINSFNSALKIGINNIENLITETSPEFVSKEELTHYWKNNIDYNFNPLKEEALSKFLEFIKHNEVTDSFS